MPRFEGALATLLTVLLIASPAAAFCRSTTCKGDCPADADGCPSTGKPLSWAGGCVGFSFQKDLTTKLPAADVKAAVRRSFQSWTGVPCPGGGQASIAFSEAQDVTCALSTYADKGPNVNVVLFRDYDFPYRGIDNTLAKTTVTFEATTGEILDADIEVNAAFNEVTTVDTKVVYDLESIMTHEIGHFLGIAHTQVAAATMNGAYDVGSTTFRSLDPDDIAAACAIYPPGRKATCDPTPRGGLAVTCDAKVEEPESSGCAIASGEPGGQGKLDGARALPAVLLGLLVAARRSRRRAQGAA